MNWFNKGISQVEKELQTNIKEGLTEEQVKANYEKYGMNELKQKKKKSLFVKFLEQFKDFMIIVLIIAAIVSGAVGIAEGEGKQPSQNRGGRCQFFNEAVHGIAQYVGIVQFYIQVRTQFQFPCQIAHYGLEEGVDGFYTKTAVIMQHVLQCCSCCPTDVRVR